MKSKLFLITAMLIFGSIGLFVKEIPLPSAQIALVRGIIGSLFLFLASILMKKKLSWASIKPNLLLLMVSGAAMGFNWILLFEAYRYTSIANATLSYYIAPVIVVFLSPFILKERLTKVKVLSICAAMTGMILVMGIGKGGSFEKRELIGIGFGLSAAILYASVVMINKFLKNLTGLETTFVQIFMSALVLLPYVIYNGPMEFEKLNGNSLFLLIILGLVNTGIAYLLYFTAIQKVDGQIAAIFSYIDPISAILMSSLFLQESLSLVQLLGGIMILGGAFFGGRKK